MVRKLTIITKIMCDILDTCALKLLYIIKFNRATYCDQIRMPGHKKRFCESTRAKHYPNFFFLCTEGMELTVKWLFSAEDSGIGSCF